MARSLALPVYRENLSFQHADQAALGAFSYSVSLGRWRHLPDLSHRGNRCLRAFAALNRSGVAGYNGVKAPIAALAAFVARATDEAFSTRTAFRALAELVERGYLVKGRFGGGNPRLIIDKKSGVDYWIRDQRCVFTLTAKALSIWGKPRPSPLPPPAPGVGQEPCKAVGVSECGTKPDPSLHVPSWHGSKSAEGLKTSDQSPNRDQCSCPTSRAGEGKRAEPGFCPAFSSRSLALAGSKGTAERVPSRTINPKKSQWMTSTDRARLILATAIHVCEAQGRGGKASTARIALELSDRKPLYPSGVDWAHWLKFWPEMSHAQRRHTMRAEILPLIMTAPTPAPKPKPAPVAPISRYRPTPTEAPQALTPKQGTSPASIFNDPHLANIARKLNLFPSHDPNR